MGTEIEYAINLLAALPDNNILAAGGGCVDVWEHFQNKGLRKNCLKTGINKLQEPMDRRLDKNNIESIKKKMQMHESIFKYQVQELHRLYSVQKMMMEELKTELKQKRFWSCANGLEYKNHHNYYIKRPQPTTNQPKFGLDYNFQTVGEDQCSRERSGSCSGDNIRTSTIKCFDLERPADQEDISARVQVFDEIQAGSGSHMMFRSSKMSIDDSDEGGEVELTLSIGGSRGEKKAKSPVNIKELDSSASLKSDRGLECSDPNTPISSSSVTFDQERKRPHWLFQGLKL